jgi:choline kinase
VSCLLCFILTTDNDTQYGNLLKLDAPRNGPDHHQVSFADAPRQRLTLQYIVIDFEYAAPSARGYDIANHFHEWRANYHHPTLSHSLQPHFPYPSLEQRKAFYRSYLDLDDGPGVEALEREVRIWSPASSVFWAMWGLVQAEEQVENLIDGITATDFDYLVSGADGSKS